MKQLRYFLGFLTGYLILIPLISHSAGQYRQAEVKQNDGAAGALDSPAGELLSWNLLENNRRATFTPTRTSVPPTNTSVPTFTPTRSSTPPTGATTTPTKTPGTRTTGPSFTPSRTTMSTQSLTPTKTPAHRTPTRTPTPPFMPTPTPLPPFLIDLLLNQTLFFPGDWFSLQLEVENHSIPENLDTYIVLDITGLGVPTGYYFWPSWESDLDYKNMDFRGYSYQTIDIVNFSWPEGAGTAYGIVFWAVLAKPESIHLYSNIDSVTFGYRE